jgi:hypothetical protein
MKKAQFLFLTTILFSFLLSTGCNKGKEGLPGDPDGPDVVLPTSGHLVCIGKGRQGYMDTLTFWHSTIGSDMDMFLRQSLRPADEIRFTANGDGTVTIRRKEPHVQNNINYDKFGIEVNGNPVFSSFPDNAYLWTMYHQVESVLNHFVIKRDQNDIYKFTIESKAFPGYFLGVEKWKNAAYPTTDRLVFTTTGVTWWFEQR